VGGVRQGRRPCAKAPETIAPDHPRPAPDGLNHRNARLTNLYVHQVFGMIDRQALGTSG
jgi:hypothetical protein